MDNFRVKQSERYTVIADTVSISPKNFDEIIDLIGATANVVVTINSGAIFQSVTKIIRNSGAFLLRVQAGSGATLNGLTGTPSRITLYPGDTLVIRTTSLSNTWQTYEFSPLNLIQSQTFTASGNGTNTVSIPHGLGTTPSYVSFPTPLNAASAGVTYITKDATNIIIRFAANTVAAANNLLFDIAFRK